MKRNTIIALAAISAVSLGGFAYAAQGYKEHKKMKRFLMPEKIMEQVDGDGDNAASRQELIELITKRFSDADSDSNGQLSKVEIVSGIEALEGMDRLKRHSGKISDRMIRQFDIDESGQISLAEIENRVLKFHSIADWNDDQKVEISELKRLRAGFGRHRQKK